MDFYTNVQQYGNRLHVIGYKDGKRYKKAIPYKPYVFVASQKPTGFKTIYGANVDRLDFDTIKEARDFIKSYEDVSNFKIHGQTKWPYVYIYHNYPTKEYDPETIKVLYIDIETKFKDAHETFQDYVEKATKPITAITVRLNNTSVAFGYGDFDAPEGVTYAKCKDEVSLLRAFIKLWNMPEWTPDVVSGWNIEAFDIPYIINRVKRLLGDAEARKLSPWEVLKTKDVHIAGRDITIYHPMGINILDYQQLYKKFTYNEQASYALNNIARVELGEEKVDYSEYGSLDELCDRDHQKFMEYNVHDVTLVARLEEKLRFIELVYAIAYDAGVNFNDALTSVLLWDIIIYNYLMDKNIVIPPYERKNDRRFEGGYVKEPKVGMSDWVMSFDLKSLYPHIIIQYNISPETFVEKIDNVGVEDVLHSDQPITGKCTMTANGCYFLKQPQGFLAALMERQFDIRTMYRKMYMETKEVKYDKAQMAKKIQLNSLYGSLSNIGFRFYNADMAEAITLSGQLSIRFMHDRVNEFMNRVCGTVDEDYIIAVDTDSLYITFGKLVQKYWPDLDRSMIVNLLNEVANRKLMPYIAEQYDVLGKKMNVAKQAMEMNREVIGDKAFWKGKKHYVINMLDKEGKRFEQPELKIMGIETVRSSTPEICRTALEEAIYIIMNEDEDALHKYVAEFKKRFFKAPFDEISFPSTANNLEKYSDAATLYKLKTPVHVKGALIYNKILRERNMLSKYTPIFEGEKVKWAYLKMPNPAKDTVISAPNGYLPFVDIGDFIDYNTQWDKAFIDPLESILKKIGWSSKKEATLASLFE